MSREYNDFNFDNIFDSSAIEKMIDNAKKEAIKDVYSQAVKAGKEISSSVSKGINDGIKSVGVRSIPWNDVINKSINIDNFTQSAKGAISKAVEEIQTTINEGIANTSTNNDLVKSLTKKLLDPQGKFGKTDVKKMAILASRGINSISVNNKKIPVNLDTVLGRTDENARDLAINTKIFNEIYSTLKSYNNEMDNLTNEANVIIQNRRNKLSSSDYGVEDAKKSLQELEALEIKIAQLKSKSGTPNSLKLTYAINEIKNLKAELETISESPVVEELFNHFKSQIDNNDVGGSFNSIISGFSKADPNIRKALEMLENYVNSIDTSTNISEYTNKIKELTDEIISCRDFIKKEAGEDFTSLLFNPDGMMKSGEQLKSEIMSEYQTIMDSLYKKYEESGFTLHLTDDDYIKELGDVFNKYRAASFYGGVNSNDFDDNFNRLYQESHNTFMDDFDEDAGSHLSIAFDKYRQLNDIKLAGEEKYLSLLEREKEISQLYSNFQSKYSKASNINPKEIDISDDEALSQKESLSSDLTLINQLIEKVNILESEAGQCFGEDSRTWVWKRDLSEYKKLIEDNIFAYENFRDIQKREQIRIQENILDQAYGNKYDRGEPKEFTRLYDNLETKILDGSISAQEAIEQLDAKAKELGITFDEDAKKWNQISTSANAFEESGGQLSFTENYKTKEKERTDEMGRIRSMSDDELNSEFEKTKEELDACAESAQNYIDKYKEYTGITKKQKDYNNYNIARHVFDDGTADNRFIENVPNKNEYKALVKQAISDGKKEQAAVLFDTAHEIYPDIKFNLTDLKDEDFIQNFESYLRDGKNALNELNLEYDKYLEKARYAGEIKGRIGINNMISSQENFEEEHSQRLRNSALSYGITTPEDREKAKEQLKQQIGEYERIFDDWDDKQSELEDRLDNGEDPKEILSEFGIQAETIEEAFSKGIWGPSEEDVRNWHLLSDTLKVIEEIDGNLSGNRSVGNGYFKTTFDVSKVVTPEFLDEVKESIETTLPSVEKLFSMLDEELKGVGTPNSSPINDISEQAEIAKKSISEVRAELMNLLSRDVVDSDEIADLLGLSIDNVNNRMLAYGFAGLSDDQIADEFMKVYEILKKYESETDEIIDDVNVKRTAKIAEVVESLKQEGNSIGVHQTIGRDIVESILSNGLTNNGSGFHETLHDGGMYVDAALNGKSILPTSAIALNGISEAIITKMEESAQKVFLSTPILQTLPSELIKGYIDFATGEFIENQNYDPNFDIASYIKKSYEEYKSQTNNLIRPGGSFGEGIIKNYLETLAPSPTNNDIVSDEKELLASDIKALAEYIAKNNGVPILKLQEVIDQIYPELVDILSGATELKEVDGFDGPEMIEMAKSTPESILNILEDFIRVSSRNKNEEYQKVRNWINNSHILMDGKKEIEEYGSEWNSMRSTIGASVVNKTKGQDITNFLKEMNDAIGTDVKISDTDIENWKNLVDYLNSFKTGDEEYNNAREAMLSGIETSIDLFKEEGVEGLGFESVSEVLEEIVESANKASEALEEFKDSEKAASGQTPESVNAMAEEANKLEDISESAEKASTKKKKFTKANKEVAEQTPESVDAISDEAEVMDDVEDEEESNSTSNYERLLNKVPGLFNSSLKGNHFSQEKLYNLIDEITEEYSKIDFDELSEDEYDRISRLNDGLIESLSNNDSMSKILNSDLYTEDYHKLIDNLQNMLRDGINDFRQNVAGDFELTDEDKADATQIFDSIHEALLDPQKNAKGQSIDKLNKDINDLISTAHELSDDDIERLKELRNSLSQEGLTDKGLAKIAEQFRQIKNNVTAARTPLLDIRKIIDQVGSNILTTIGTYVSFQRLWQEIKKGWQYALQFDTAITKISYTMDLTNRQLDMMGKNIIELSRELGTSISNMATVYQIYSNMNTDPEEIKTLAESTAILSNLAGVDASTAADQIQGVVHQFENLESTDVSHIVDVFDYISANIGVDYSKGITGIAQAVQTVGNVADQAGLSFEQLSAIIATTMEQTRQDGSSIANGLKTIMVRISKASKLDDTIDNETLSKASESLHAIGVDVYDTTGKFRDFNTIMGELSKKWDTLNDAQQAEISFNVAATRQTAVFKSILQNWDKSKKLSEDAQNTNGNAISNQEKYLESYAGKIQQIQNNLQEFWINFMDSKLVSQFLSFLKELTNSLVKIQKHLGSGGVLGLALGVVAAFRGLINAFKTNGLLGTIKKFSDSFEAARRSAQGTENSVGNIFKGLGKSLVKFAAITAALVAISNIIIGITAQAKRISEATEKYNESMDSLDDTVKTLKKQKEIINDTNSSIDEISEARNTCFDIEKDLLNKYKDDYDALNKIKSVFADINTSADKLKETVSEIEYSNLLDSLEIDWNWNKENNFFSELGREIQNVGSAIGTSVKTGTTNLKGANYNYILDSMGSKNLVTANAAFKQVATQFLIGGSIAEKLGIDYMTPNGSVSRVKNIGGDNALAEYIWESIDGENKYSATRYDGNIYGIGGDVYDKYDYYNKVISALEAGNKTDTDLYKQAVSSQKDLKNIIEANKETYEAIVLNDYINGNKGTESDKDRYSNLFDSYMEYSNNKTSQNADLFISSYQDLINDSSVSNEVKTYVKGLYKDAYDSLYHGDLTDFATTINYIVEADYTYEDFLNDFKADKKQGNFSASSAGFWESLAIWLDIGDPEKLYKSKYKDKKKYVSEDTDITGLTKEEIDEIIKINSGFAMEMSTQASSHGFKTINDYLDALVEAGVILDDAGKKIINRFGEDNLKLLEEKYGKGTDEYNERIRHLTSINPEDAREKIREYIDTYKDLDPTQYIDSKSYIANMEKIAKLNELYYENDREFLMDLIELGDDFIASLESDTYKYSTEVGNVQKTQSGFDMLDAIYTDIKDYGTSDGSGRTFDYSSLTSDDFKNTFGSLADYENFVEQVANNTAGMTAEVQDQFNKLVTQLVFASDTFEHLDSSTIDFTTNFLKQMGVTNAAEGVEKAYNAQLDYSTLALERRSKGIVISTDKLEKATISDVLALRNEEGQFDETSQAIFDYWLAKNIANIDDIITTSSSEQLIALAEAAGIATEAILRLKEVQDKISYYQGMVDSSTGSQKNIAQKYLDNYLAEQTQIQTDLKDGLTKYYQNVDWFTYGGGDKSKSQANSAAKESKEQLDKAIEYLEKQLDANQITFGQYLNARLDLIQDYYDKGLIKASEYYEELEGYYKAQLDGYDSAIQAIDDVIDEEIKRINDEKQALSDANDERQKAIDLQKAEYDLARAQNQRTRLVKLCQSAQ